MISHLHELIFFHVPKCAGMSVELALGGLKREHRIEQHWGYKTVKRFYPDEYATYTSFAVVRHPLERALSMTRFLRRFDPVYRLHLGHVSDTALVLDMVMGFNVLTQSTADKMLPDGVTTLRFEHLDDDWRGFAADYALPSVLPRINQAPSVRTPLDTSERRLLSHVVATAFPRDYTRFGYSLPTDGDALSLADRGVVAWTALHVWARSLPAQMDVAAQVEARQFLEGWIGNLPDAGWQDRVHAVMRQTPVEMTGERHVRLWASALHDQVNEALGKPLWCAWRP